MLKALVNIARILVTIYLLVEAWHGTIWAVALLLTLQVVAVEVMSALLVRRGKEYWW